MKLYTVAHKIKLSHQIVKSLIMTKAAGFIIFRKTGPEFEYLLLQASYGIKHWTPPKGHVEPGETEMDTAFRETKEETGFKKEDLKLMTNFKRVLQVVYQKQLLFCQRGKILNSLNPQPHILVLLFDGGKELTWDEYPVNGKQKTVVYWLAELSSKTPVVLSKEHQDYKWLNLSEACKLGSYPEFQKMLKESEEFLSKNYKKE